MPTVQIRNMSDELYNMLVKSAEDSRRSITQEAIVLLETALSINKESRKSHKQELLERIDKMKLSKYVDTNKTVDWIRADRDSR